MTVVYQARKKTPKQGRGGFFRAFPTKRRFLNGWWCPKHALLAAGSEKQETADMRESFLRILEVSREDWRQLNFRKVGSNLSVALL